MENTLLSFVIPCYRSEKTISIVINEIIDTVKKKKGYDYEIICINDCSPDNVQSFLEEISNHNQKVKIVTLSKNMGKHSAVMAGYSFAGGDYIVNLDDDGQSPVDHLWELMELVENDLCDVATAEYTRKKESFWKRAGSDFNLFISEIMLDKPKGLRFENFSIIKRFVMIEVLNYKNPYPYLEGLVLRVTKRVMSVPMEERERADDNVTGFTFWKSLSLFANGFTNFSVKPLRFALILGSIFAVCGIIYGIAIVIKRIFDPNMALGWSSIMSVSLFSSGIIMVLLGVIGEYIGRIFICINDSPQYVIRKTINIEKNIGSKGY